MVESCLLPVNLLHGVIKKTKNKTTTKEKKKEKRKKEKLINKTKDDCWRSKTKIETHTVIKNKKIKTPLI